jgi:valyl-tRNA synthetase
LIDEEVEWEMQAVIDLISRVRNLRSEMNIKAGERVPILIGSPDEKLRKVFSASVDHISRLARASDVSISDRLNAPRASARAVLAGGAEVAIPLEGLIDFAQERQRLRKEQDKLQAEVSKLEAQLGNASFVERAPEEKVNELRARIADIAQRSAQLKQTIENLQ